MPEKLTDAGAASSIARPWPTPRASPPSSWPSSSSRIATRRRQGAGPRARAASPSWSARSSAARRGDRRRRPRRWPCSMSPPRWPSSRPRATTAARWSTTARAFDDQGRAPSGGRGGAARASRPAASSPTTAISAPAQRLWLRDRPQHGRQIDLPAPERADRHAGADRLLRAGAAPPISASSTGCSAASAPPTISRAAARPSWSRWWRRRRS